MNKLFKSKLRISDYIDEICPEKIFIFNEPSINLKKYLIIDNSAFRVLLSGIRMAPNTSMTELLR